VGVKTRMPVTSRNRFVQGGHSCPPQVPLKFRLWIACTTQLGVPHPWALRRQLEDGPTAGVTVVKITTVRARAI